MRILMISPTQHGVGGIPNHVDGLVNFLQRRGHEVYTISADNTPIIPIYKLKNISFMLSALLKSKIIQYNPDIVHAHNVPAALAMRYAYGKKILTLHGVFSDQVTYLHGSTLGNMLKRYETSVLGWADAITAVSKEAVNHYSNLGYVARKIPNAISIADLPQGTEELYENQIIYAGRLSNEKGVRVLVDIIKHLPSNIHLIVAGSGPDEKLVIRAAENRPNIHVLSHLPKEHLIPLLRGSRIMIQPSLYEGISSSILEAMACQTLVITTNVGGNVELVRDGQNGILVDSDNYKAVLSKILQYMVDDTAQNSIIERATSFVKQYDWENIGIMYLKLYESLID